MGIAIDLVSAGPAAVLRIAGVLDEKAAGQVWSRAEEVIALGFRNIVLNLAGVTTMTAAGVMLIESIRHDVAINGGHLVLTEPQQQPAEMLTVYGLSGQMSILASESEALELIKTF